VSLAALSQAGSSRAHGGENHGPPTATATPTATEHVSAAETELFTVVVKYPPRGAGGRLAVRVFVADATTSAPIANASVQLEVQGAAGVRAITREPGIYETSIPEPRAGTHADAVVTVEAETVDFVTLSGLEFGPFATAAAATPHAAPGSRTPWIAGALGLGLLAATGGIAAVVRRRRPTAHPAEGGSP
jgi:hypothetical protein